MNQANQLNIQLHILKKNIYMILHFLRKMIAFIYQPKLDIGNKYLQDIPSEPIQQNIVYIKLNIFLKALQKTNEINQKEKNYTRIL